MCQGRHIFSCFFLSKKYFRGLLWLLRAFAAGGCMLSVSESWGVFVADALVVAWSCGMLLIDSLQLFGRQNSF